MNTATKMSFEKSSGGAIGHGEDLNSTEYEAWPFVSIF